MSTRKSSRLKSKPPVTFDGLELETSIDEYANFVEDNNYDSDHAHGRSCSKRKKTGASSGTVGWNAKVVKGRRGKLGALPEMPIDILYEIFGHLRPYDILRLAWTTKALRRILMQRSAISVWKDARSNVNGLPDCPRDLTEPQYARLAFDPFCHLCGAPNVHTIVWRCRLRSCQKCLSSGCFVDSYNTIQSIAGVSYKDLLPCEVVKIGKNRRRFVFAAADFEATYQEATALEGDEPSFDKYVQERREMVAAITAHAALCEGWQRGATSDRQLQLQDLKGRRREAIFTKLKELGWGEELDKNGHSTLLPLTSHTLVKKPQELTERVWSNIKEPLIEILEELKEKRQLKERLTMLMNRQNLVAKLLRDYTLERPINDVIPGPADVCDMDEFSAIIKDTPDDVEVSEGTFKPAMYRLPQFIAEWRAAKDAELTRILNKATVPDGQQSEKLVPELGDRTQLELATTIFRCNCCNSPISYPRILVHSCMHRLRDVYNDYDHPLSKLLSNLGDEPWNYGGDRVRIDDQGQATVRLVVKCCGLDPDIATAHEMDVLDARFECVKCCNPLYGSRMVMGWRIAVHHGVMKHTPLVEWKLVNEVDTTRVKQIEKKKDLLTQPTEFVCCTRCRHKTYNIKIHLSMEHGVEEMSEDDYYWPLDAAFGGSEACWLPSPKEDERPHEP